MTTYKLGVPWEKDTHVLYDPKTGEAVRRNGKLHWTELQGSVCELHPGDFWGGYRKDDGSWMFFRNDAGFPDDPERFLVWVDILSPNQAQVHYVWDGAVVESVVYARVLEFGINPYDMFEEDVDNFLYWSQKHFTRRAKWPLLFENKP